MAAFLAPKPPACGMDAHWPGRGGGEAVSPVPSCCTRALIPPRSLPLPPSPLSPLPTPPSPPRTPQHKDASKGRGILAMDESNATCGKRLQSIGLENTEDSRRAYRELLVTTPGLGQYISGAIMFEETLFQKVRGSGGERARARSAAARRNAPAATCTCIQAPT